MFSSLMGYSLIINVPTDQPTIQAAIATSSQGDTVLVAKGTYNESISFDGKNIVVASHYLTTGDSLCIDETIIRGISGSVVTFQYGETEKARLVGFTLKDGYGTKEGTTWYGGGIFCKHSHPTLEDLKVAGNTLGGFGSCGAGMYFRESNSLVINCRIETNESVYGAGIRCDQSNITVRNTWFRDNFASTSGGGIMFYECQSSRIEQCTFTGNNGIYGGAISSHSSNPVIDRVTSFHNHGGYGGTINIEASSNPIVINSIFWENSLDPNINNEIFLTANSNTLVVAFSDILGGDTAIRCLGSSTVDWLEGNIELYPEFINPFTLDLTLTETSPCINAGTAIFIDHGDTIVNITDYSGEAPDMGAYEFFEPITSDQLPLSIPKFDLQVRAGNSSDDKIVCFTLPKTQPVQLDLFDMRGRNIDRLVNSILPSGDHRINMNTTGLQTGIYILRITNGRISEAKKLLVN